MSVELTRALLKIGVMIAFFIIVMVFGTLPLRSRTFKKRPLLRALGATFAGCLFINVAILHILPEAADTLQQLLKKNDEDEVFPLAELLMMVGFIITVFFTKVLTFHSHNDQHSQVSNVDDQHPESIQKHEEDDKHENGNGTNIKSKQCNKIEKQKTQIQQSLVTDNQCINEKMLKNQLEEKGHSHHHQLNKSVLSQALILTVAIYFHTIFQGIAIGVQQSITGFLSIAVAIGFHKWADALSMGCHYRTKGISKKLAYLLILGQAILNVLAIGLGWIISTSGDVVDAVFLSLSAGTFLAISTIQMLGEQLHDKNYMLIKFLLLVGATGFVVSIWFIQNRLF